MSDGPREIAIVNGVLSPAEEATVSILDLGLLRGMAVFETLRTYGGGHPYALQAHLERLWRGAEILGLAPLLTEKEARALLRRAYEASGLPECRAILLVTPGPNVGSRFGRGDPTLAVIVRALGAPAPEVYETGIAAVTFRAERSLAEWKTTSYLPAQPGIDRAAEAAAGEAFYVNAAGEVTEGVTSNLIGLYGDTLRAPVKDALRGITRAAVSEVASELGLAWEHGPLSVEKVYEADELWICSSVRELVPVVSVNGKPIGSGRPGRWLRPVLDRFRERALNSALADAGEAG